MNTYNVTEIPFNIEAEQCTIGSVIIHNDALRSCAFLKPSDFYREAHQVMWEAILDLDAHGTAIDFVTLTDWLETRDKLKQLPDSFAYVSRVAVAIPTAAHARHYALIVYRAAFQRRLVAAGENIKKAGLIAGEEVQKLAALADGELRNATMGVAGDADIPAYQALDFVANTLRRVHETGVPPAMSMALPTMERLARGWRRGEVTVLGALTNVGKTRFAYNELVYQAEQGRGTVYCHKETEAEGVSAGLAARVERIDEAQLQDGFSQKDVMIDRRTGNRIFPHRRNSPQEVEAALYSAQAKIKDMGIQIVAAYPDPITGDIVEPDFTVVGLRNKLREIARRHPVDFVVIDHLSLLELPDGMSSHESSGKFGKAVMDFIRLAQELQCHILLLHQLRPDAINQRQPSHYQFEESKKIAQNANNCITLYKPSQHGDERATPGEIVFNMSKSRRAQTGLVTGVKVIGAYSYFYDEELEHLEQTAPHWTGETPHKDDYDIDF